MVDDWENVTKNNQLVPIPHPHPVDQVLKDYLDTMRPERAPGTASGDVLEETIYGLKEYFEKALPRILLYRYASPSPCVHCPTNFWCKVRTTAVA